MATPSRAPRVTARAADELNAVGILDNPYLRALREGALPLEAFRRSQEQFFFAVTFFPRPMAALVARIPSPRGRLDILHNLVDEHGEFREESFHHTTFQAFLRSIGSDPATLEGRPPWPALRAFNSVLSTACLLDELEVGIGCLGVIEYAFADVSSIIARAIVAQGWLSEERLVHYKLHAEIDKRHAEEFFVLLEPAWDEPARRYAVEQGIALGAHVFDRLYRELHVACLAAPGAQGAPAVGGGTGAG
jgi:pyrroloquinoline-quinone synthase